MSEASIAAADYLDTAFVAKGLGGWRALYLHFIEELKPECVLEVGSGTPDFLAAVKANRRVAVDIGGRFAADFRRLGIDFRHGDVEGNALAGLSGVDVAVCSDVFEHLLHPERALAQIAQTLTPTGVLLSHVPNEFRLGHLTRVAFGMAKASRFHVSSEEWDDPHIRRFTPRGYRKFLKQRFSLNLQLTELRYQGAARALHAAGLGVPFCLQGGPTFASTNDSQTLKRLTASKRRLSN